MGQKKRFRKWVVRRWATIATWLFLFVLPATLYGVALGSHANGVLPQEQAYISSVGTASGAMSTPGFLPHRVVTYGLLRVGADHIVWFRLVSVACAVLAVLCVYYVLHRWYTRRVALIGSILFSTSSLVLHYGRAALPNVMLLAVVGLIATGLWLQITKRRKRALLVFVTALASTVYIPGLVWVTLGVLFWQGKRLLRVLGKQSALFRIATVLAIALVLTPAIVTLALHPRELLTVAGLPTQLSSTSSYIDHVINTLLGIGWRYEISPSLWLARTPILDVMSIAMLVLGFYSLRFERKLLRSRIQVGLLILGLLLSLAMGPVTLLAVVPILYLIITGGFAFMLQQWFTVFPRNPIARAIAVILISTSVLGVATYHVYRYAEAWPNHPETKSVITDQYLVK